MELFSTTVEELPSANYFLVVTAYNGYIGTASDSVKVMKFFSVRNPDKDFAVARQQGPLLLQADVIDPIYAGMKEEELDREFSKVKPIARDDEKRIWRELQGAEAKGRFLTSFWLKRDPTLETAENEYHDSYDKLVEKAHAMYYSPMNPNGWDTDRGRVMLQYGEPDYIDRHQNEFNKRPYQVWSYTNLGYQFVFVDRTQTGTYTLVHSNAPGEPRFENWESEFATIHSSQEYQGTGNYSK
jgi:GWxTD domain-containing protein